MNLTNQIQAQEFLNKQLNERLSQKEVPATVEVGQGDSIATLSIIF